MALWLTRKPATLKNSYGYHRADVIGALGSIMIIWGLLIWLLIEAVHRLLNPTDIDGELMLIIAIFGLCCNVTNLVILTCCCNEKDEEGRALNMWESVASAYKPYYGNAISSEIRKSKIKSMQGSFARNRALRESTNKLDIKEEDPLSPTSPGVETSDSNTMGQSQHKLNRTEKHMTVTDSEAQSPTDPMSPAVYNDQADIKEDRLIMEQKMQEQPLVVVEEVDQVKTGNDENLNVRAAIVHMVGDMLQSIGVIVAAVIIYLKPDWTIADPICTFLFTILVMFTTVPIFTDCMRFLMESSPESIDAKDVYNAIMKLEMVEEIHDFHLWSLSDEKPIFTAHVVVTGNPSYALYNITQLLQEDFEIFHTTVQIEPAKKSHLQQKKQTLQRCLNEHNFKEQPLPADA